MDAVRRRRCRANLRLNRALSQCFRYWPMAIRKVGKKFVGSHHGAGRECCVVGHSGVAYTRLRLRPHKLNLSGCLFKVGECRLELTSEHEMQADFLDVEFVCLVDGNASQHTNGTTVSIIACINDANATRCVT